jgi:hypothetical protein
VPTEPIFLLPTSWDRIDNGLYKIVRYPPFRLIIPLYLPTTLIRYPPFRLIIPLYISTTLIRYATQAINVL